MLAGHRRLVVARALEPPPGDEAEVQEIAAYTMPARSRFLSTQTNKRRQPNKRLNNSHGIFAFRTLQGGMTSGLTSASRPWFSLGSSDEGLMDDAEVKAWFAEVEGRDPLAAWLTAPSASRLSFANLHEQSA